MGGWTPGPYAIDAGLRGGPGVAIVAKREGKDAVVARVPVGSGGGERQPRQNANATLLENAPDLYDWLRETVEFAETLEAFRDANNDCHHALIGAKLVLGRVGRPLDDPMGVNEERRADEALDCLALEWLSRRLGRTLL